MFEQLLREDGLEATVAISNVARGSTTGNEEHYLIFQLVCCAYKILADQVYGFYFFNYYDLTVSFSSKAEPHQRDKGEVKK